MFTKLITVMFAPIHPIHLFRYRNNDSPPCLPPVDTSESLTSSSERRSSTVNIFDQKQRRLESVIGGESSRAAAAPQRGKLEPIDKWLRQTDIMRERSRAAASSVHTASADENEIDNIVRKKNIKKRKQQTTEDESHRLVE